MPPPPPKALYYLFLVASYAAFMMAAVASASTEEYESNVETYPSHAANDYYANAMPQVKFIDYSACHFGNTDTCSDDNWYHRTRRIYWASALSGFDELPEEPIEIEIPMLDHLKNKTTKNKMTKDVHECASHASEHN
ncbi:hypothetical protein SBRCBS47491_006977 [Sporothrix bragantina]|uniref:Uncharacterized protein n=1 Tax=Sporothrix bragantina TaxID=671064 RepID=A0ABP0CBM5_9PEZI